MFDLLPIKRRSAAPDTLSEMDETFRRMWYDFQFHNLQEKSDIGWIPHFDVSETDNEKRKRKAKESLTEIFQLKVQLEAERAYLREEIKLENNDEKIIGQSDALKYVLYKVRQIASSDTTVLILGETGTGKELVAQAIHNLSMRKNRALVKVNCAQTAAG